ncbi:MAG: hypothetical protein IIV74_04175 [Alphaproteobacteria bacterium]|nr:hypothetical protein [Alphaproteobacteria bacterium]
MNSDTIIRLLTNSGFYNVRVDPDFVYMEDPSCILRSFETFIDYAWWFIMFLTGAMLTGWAISMIRGAKNDFFTNMRNLIIIFGVLSMAKPIMNFIYGDDLFAHGCRTISVPISEMNKLLDARDAQLKSQDDLYEVFDIFDSGVIYSEEESIAPSELGDIDIGLETETLTQITDSPSSTSRYHSATASGYDVIVVGPDGKRYKRSGGTRAWRNNNPGNIRPGKFSRSIGGIGSAGGFAVFPDEQTGMLAIKKLLLTNSYKNLTVAGAISRWAPPSENNTAGYQRQVARLTGLSISRKISELSAEELTRVANAIRQVEGWRPGKVTQI